MGSAVVYESSTTGTLGEQCFYMLLIYAKAVQDDMTPTQLRVLRRLVQDEFP